MVQMSGSGQEQKWNAQKMLSGSIDKDAFCPPLLSASFSTKVIGLRSIRSLQKGKEKAEHSAQRSPPAKQPFFFTSHILFM
jgi:hypothetical protein